MEQRDVRLGIFTIGRRFTILGFAIHRKLATAKKLARIFAFRCQKVVELSGWGQKNGGPFGPPRV